MGGIERLFSSPAPSKPDQGGTWSSREEPLPGSGDSRSLQTEVIPAFERAFITQTPGTVTLPYQSIFSSLLRLETRDERHGVNIKRDESGFENEGEMGNIFGGFLHNSGFVSDARRRRRRTWDFSLLPFSLSGPAPLAINTAVAPSSILYSVAYPHRWDSLSHTPWPTTGTFARHRGVEGGGDSPGKVTMLCKNSASKKSDERG